MRKQNLEILVACFLLINSCVTAQTGWFLQNSGQSYWNLNSVHFINQTTGFAAGNNGTLSMTTNSGLNWFLQTTGTNNDFNSIFFPSTNTGYIIGTGGVLVKSTDGGLNWNLYPAGTTDPQYSIFFNNDNTGYVGAYNGNVLKTTDGGLNWNSYNTGSNAYLYSIFFLNINTGFVCGYISGNPNVGVICKTTNGGLNWNYRNIPTMSIAFSLFFTTTSLGYCGGFVSGIPGVILNTTDGGVTWVTQYLSSGLIMSIYFSDSFTGYAGGSGGKVFKTTNGGANWVPQQNLATSNQLNSVYFNNNLTGYAVGSSGTIIKTTNGGNPLGIDPKQRGIPKRFALFQNYPNPFNPTTKIQYMVAQNSHIELKVFDAAGHQAALLVNEQQTPGTYETEFDGSTYASGVYFYKLTITNDASAGLKDTEGLLSITRKMVMMK